jgi:cold shock CspA family protein
MEGRVKTVNSKGFGFIETAKDIDFFFHHSDYNGKWKELLGHNIAEREVYVIFDVDKESREPRAINVKLLEVKG